LPQGAGNVTSAKRAQNANETVNKVVSGAPT
jgi:hypothetical protein